MSNDHSNRSFFIALSLVLASISMIYLLIHCSPCRYLIRYVFFYYLLLMLIAALPLAAVKKMGWAASKTASLLWFGLLTGLAWFIAAKQEPNLLGMVHNISGGRFDSDQAAYTFFSMLTYSGLVSLFYFGVDILYPRFFEPKETQLKGREFGVLNLFYLVYLNAMVSILNPFFSRPF